MKIIRKILLGIFIVILLIAGAAFVSLKYLGYRNAHYYENATPSGKYEAKYTALGAYEVSYMEFDTGNEAYDKLKIWYPSELEAGNALYPLVVMANGTGVRASQYKEVFRHLASWGFIVIGNEDSHSRSGDSSAASLDFALSLNDSEESGFYRKVDINNIGIGGHSQGGVGAVNAVTNQSNGSYYKAAYLASLTSPFWGQEAALGLDWSYDASKINIPCFIVAGTGAVDAGTAIDIHATEGQGISSLWGMQATYYAISDSVSKVMARQVGKDHGDMLRSADGYMTAWFMYWLKGEAQAGDVFFGDQAEILNNDSWQDIIKNK